MAKAGYTRRKSTRGRTKKTGSKSTNRLKIDNDYSVGGYCSARAEIRQNFGSDINGARLEAIIVNDKKWANGTRLKYYFFDRAADGDTRLLQDGTTDFVSWVGPEKQKKVVRDAFKAWKTVGIGLDFEEVSDRAEAEIRIGFMPGDGSWSYVGRDVLTRGLNARTMNFGWDLTREDGRDTALHEIGHTLGMPHEHQNPNAGIVWNEEEVIRSLAGPPNFWPPEKTFHNIIRKLDPATVSGTEWDPNSVMHYPFAAGMIVKPEQFQTQPLVPAGGLSPRDRAWVKQSYPPIAASDIARMEIYQAERMELNAGEQFNGVFTPDYTRRYTIQTFGPTDMVLTVFEDMGDETEFVAGDDDSGYDRNARIPVRLRKGRDYLVRARLFFSWDSGPSAVMIY